MDRPTFGDRSSQSGAPEWVQDAIFYQIFPDRFARSEAVSKPSNLEPWDSPPTTHGFKGGDLIGVVERLDYLQDLGINAIYFCPVFRSTANHRYHTHDYHVVDPILGGNNALERLLSECHTRNIRVILDGVFNHCSRGFFQFNHILENGAASPYIDWWQVYSWPLNPYGPADQPAGYASWWNLRELPKFNSSNPAVREFLWEVARRWIETGVDGWRLDVPNEIDDDDFWREFRRRVKGANPDAYIVGEIWGDARRWLAGDQFDAVMNYLFTKACLGFFTGVHGLDQESIRGTGLDPVEAMDTAQFAQSIEWLLGLYSWNTTLAQLNLLDSHDTVRFLTIAHGDDSALRLAWLFQMTFPGAPCIYYGDEVGMAGGATVEAARSTFSWDTETWNEDLRAHLKGAIALRHRYPVLRRGSFTTLLADDGVYAFARHDADSVAIVAFNTGSDSRRVDIQLPDEIRPDNPTVAWGDQAPEVDGSLVRGWLVAGRSGAVLTGSLNHQ